MNLLYISFMKVKEKVQVVITTPKELLLLYLIPKRGSYWQNVTGGMDKGETPTESAHRELFEETGLTAKDGKLLNLHFCLEWEGKNFIFQEHCFHFLMLEKKDPILDGKEHEKFKWVKIKDVSEENYKHASNWKVFKKAKNNLN